MSNNDGTDDTDGTNAAPTIDITFGIRTDDGGGAAMEMKLDSSYSHCSKQFQIVRVVLKSVVTLLVLCYSI